jgi:hypothetical protein
MVTIKRTRLNARSFIFFPLLLAVASSGCASWEPVLSSTLRPALTNEEVNFQVTHFHARVQMGHLEVWVRVRQDDSSYRTNFDCEIHNAAVLCSAIAKYDPTFKHRIFDWDQMDLELSSEYGSQWRWRNTYSFLHLSISRETLLDLRNRNVPASQYPQYWYLVHADKVGPPNFVPIEWFPVQPVKP